jgi:predicted transcriptional regulator
VYRDFLVTKVELEDCVNASPDFTRAFIALHRQLQDVSVRGKIADNADNDGIKLWNGASGTVESVRHFLHEHKNYFDDIDRAAENLADELRLERRTPHTALSDRLRDKHGIRVRIVPADILGGRVSSYDMHVKRLDLSELLPQSGRRFRIAYQLARLEHKDLIAAAIDKALLPSKEADELARVTLTNYSAAATLMPYGRFYQNALDTGYDVELLTRRFDTSYEQTAHRLTTLQRVGARGVPFFFVRVDMAGNISKHFSAGLFHISKFGEASPLWNIHTCFQTPGKTIPQVVEFPDGIKYFSVARAILRPEKSHGEQTQMVAIGLGCELKHAPALVYAHGKLDMPATLIGVNYY